MWDSENNLQQERALIKRAKDDSQVFGVLYDKYYSRIFNYILKRTADIEATQDLTSEVFLKALKNLDKFQWTGVPFSSWLYRIAANEIVNNFRQRARQRITVEEFSNLNNHSLPSAENEIIEAEKELQKHAEFLELHQMISQLPSKYQEVITLRFFEKKPLCEIGEILGKKEGTVKSILHRGLRKLRAISEKNATFSQDYCFDG